MRSRKCLPLSALQSSVSGSCHQCTPETTWIACAPQHVSGWSKPPVRTRMCKCESPSSCLKKSISISASLIKWSAADTHNAVTHVDLPGLSWLINFSYTQNNSTTSLSSWPALPKSLYCRSQHSSCMSRPPSHIFMILMRL